jgi:regulatory protein
MKGFSDGRETWHKHGAMAPRPPRKPRPPLNDRSLGELALFYVGRFATTKAKLRTYLGRKLRERGWEGEREPDLEALADGFARQGYVDDASFAMNKAHALAARGYGKRRLVEKLRAAGVAEGDSEGARALSDQEAVAAALRLAERRRLGPFATGAAPDPAQREKMIGTLVRAGHGFALARALVALPPGATVDPEALAEHARN